MLTSQNQLLPIIMEIYMSKRQVKGLIEHWIPVKILFFGMKLIIMNNLRRIWKLYALDREIRNFFTFHFFSFICIYSCLLNGPVKWLIKKNNHLKKNEYTVTNLGLKYIKSLNWYNLYFFRFKKFEKCKLASVLRWLVSIE